MYSSQQTPAFSTWLGGLWRYKLCIPSPQKANAQYILGTFCFCLVAKLCPTLCNSMDYSPPGSAVHGISQARILEWFAIPFSRGSSQPNDRTHISCLAGRFFTAEPQDSELNWVLKNEAVQCQALWLRAGCSSHHLLSSHHDIKGCYSFSVQDPAASSMRQKVHLHSLVL